MTPSPPPWTRSSLKRAVTGHGRPPPVTAAHVAVSYCRHASLAATSSLSSSRETAGRGLVRGQAWRPRPARPRGGGSVAVLPCCTAPLREVASGAREGRGDISRDGQKRRL